MADKRRKARKTLPIHPSLRKTLGVPDSMSDSEFLTEWKSRTQRVCKPCWELKYCPYGPIVEDFPLLPLTLGEAEEHHLYLITCLEGDCTPDGKRLDASRRRYFKAEVRDFRPGDYPPEIPQALAEMGCTVFGHICPVVFGAEPFTETQELRRRGRYISFQTKVRVVRRDNYTCQHCGKHLLDNEVEFDHVIPIAKGGSSEEHNIRLTCFKCNRDKSDDVQV